MPPKPLPPIIRHLSFVIPLLLLTACNPSNTAVPATLPAHATAAIPAPPDSLLPQPNLNNFLNSPIMLHTPYRAHSEPDKNAAGGYGTSTNFAKPVQPSSTGKGLFLLAQPEVPLPLGNSQGMRLLLVNQTSEILAFRATDSALSIIQEAQTPDGSWKPLESLPQTNCGNSYHRVFLHPNTFWQFPAPRYQGSTKANLRFTLTLADRSSLHSNTFPGSYNPSQLTEKQTLTP